MSSMRTRRGAVFAVVALASTLATGCANGPRPTPEASAARDLAARIDALVSSAVGEGRQPGASMAVATAGEVLLAKGYGLADVEGRARARAKTVYRIGSVTKQFTAAAVMDLAERGRLGVDDEVTRFLPDYPTNGYRLTIRHLLTHTSGITNYTELPQFQSISNEKVPREAVVRLFAGTFDFPPGQQWAYSNSNYYLLGLIVEKASGMPFEAYLAERILGPLHLQDTWHCPDEPVGRNHAKGYELGPGDTPRPSEPLNMQHAFAAGGLCSTVEDLVRWNEALHGGRFLSAASYELMTTPASLESGTVFPYGFGLSLESPDGSPVVSHNGGIPGFASSLAFFPTDRLTVVVLVNSSSPAGEGLIASVMSARSPGCGTDAPARAQLSPPEAHGLPRNGGFETGDVTGWTVQNQDGGHGDWFVYAGAASPLSCTFLGRPPEGTNGVTTEPCGQFRPGAPVSEDKPAGTGGQPARCVGAEDGPGSHVLYQDIALPTGMSHRLSFFVSYRNQAHTFASPATLDFQGPQNQQFRVDVLNPTADVFSVAPDDVLATVFQTKPGDQPTLATTAKTFDLSPFAGKTIRLRFAEVDNLFMFQAAVDGVKITSL